MVDFWFVLGFFEVQGVCWIPVWLFFGELKADLSYFNGNCVDVVEISRFILLASCIVLVSVFPFCW